MDVSDDWQEVHETGDEDTAMLQVPEPEGRIRIESRPHEQEENVFAQSHNGRQEHPPEMIDAGQPSRSAVAELHEEPPDERQRVADRVAYLFPRPEPTEWNIGELSYDRRRRAAPHPERRVS